MKPHPRHEHIDETASTWAARRDGGAMTARDEAELAAWLHADPEHRRQFEEYRAIQGRLGSHLEAHLVTAAEAATHTRARRRMHRIFAGLALGAAAVLACAVLFNRDSGQSLNTELAERLATVLEDGTRVDLNARTSLTVEFREDQRLVRMTGGEAFFAVVSDPQRPFVVDTPSGTVRVTGTQFNVCTIRGRHVEVTVLEGTVRVRPASQGNQELPVTAGRQAIFDATTATTRTLPEGTAEDVTAWRLGRVVFDETPLVEVIERFATYHTRAIAVDPAAAELRLGGRFSLEDLNGLLDSIESILPIRILHEPDGTVRLVRTPAEASRQ